LRARHLLIPVALVLMLLGLSIACRATINYEIYSVQPGDNLGSVASKFGVAVDKVCELNGISPSAPLRPGQSLAIPLESQSSPPPAKSSPAEGGLTGSAKATPRNGSVVGYLGEVSADIATITSKPGTGSTLYKVKKGNQVVVVGLKGEYYGLLMVDGSTGWIAKRLVQVQPVELAATPPPTSAAAGADQGFSLGRPEVIQAAYRYWGTPYKLGGSLPYSVDCSLLVQTAFAECGVKLPRTAASQVGIGYAVNSLAEAQPGDRLYFVGRDGQVNHTGIYLGSGQFLHASSLRGMVAVDALAGSYLSRLVAIRRS